MDIQKTIWVLNRLDGFGAQKFKRLLETLGDLEKLSDPDTIGKLRVSPEWGSDFVSRFSELCSSDAFNRELDQCASLGIRIVSFLDEDYPRNLASIYDPPLILYVKGALVPEDQVAIAIVGTRHPSTYGLRIAARFASELAERGLTIVSGFARGIDGQAHRGALQVKGRTIAVLGSGLDVIYPKEHTELYDEIIANGAIVSEFPLGTPPQAFNFPRRNRVISGLTLGVLVVEASLKSGSLITASLAVDEGREVYAIPGPIDSVASLGTNQWIQRGAKLVVSIEDILEDLAPQIRASLASFQDRHGKEPQSGDEAISDAQIASASLRSLPRNDGLKDPIFKLLGSQPLSFDELAVRLNENPNALRSRLTELELEGIVKRTFGGRYVRRS